MFIFALSLGGAGFGYYSVIFNPMSTPLFEGVYKFSSKEATDIKGNVNMLFSWGAMLSVLFCGKIADTIGRRRLIILYDILAVIVSLLYSIQNLHVLYAIRMVTGFVVAGEAAITSIVMTEMLPKRISAVGAYSFISVATTFVFLAYIV